MSTLVRYTINENFFSNPDKWTNAQAYWFGWMYSDGSCYMQKSGKGITTIKLQVSDKEVLEKLKNLINFTGPITTIYRPPSSILGGPIKKYQDRACLSILNQKIYQDLTSLGIVPGKASTLTFPNWLREDLVPAFIRGCFEGDGTFSINCWNKFESNFLANDSFLDGLEKKLYFLPKIGRKDIGLKNGCKRFRFAGNDSGLMFFNYIYKNHNGLILRRKYEKFLQLVEYKKSIQNKKKQTLLLNESIQIIKENA